jgi:hypothetical protein
LSTTHVSGFHPWNDEPVGLCRGDDKTELVHLIRYAVSSTVYLSSDPNEAVFDIKILPTSFALPPQSLPSLRSFPGMAEVQKTSASHSKAA